MQPPIAKRGTDADPRNRYERLHYEPDREGDSDTPTLPTEVYRDSSRSILAENDSPDLSFRFSLNPYRGCEHGCIYCYARPSHEYLSFSAGLDFERRILVKHDAPELLRRTFEARKWQPAVVALSGNTDCYQPIEKHFQLTRRCLEVFREFGNPVSIITKSALITRDVDVLSDLAKMQAAAVMISVTTLDRDLARRMEPRASQPERRLEAIAALKAAGVAVGVMMAPIVPGLNDEEMPSIAAAAAAAGASHASWVLLRLPKPVDELFADWLERNYPNRKERVLNRMRECRDGRIYDPRFGARMRGEGPYAQHLATLYRAAIRRHRLDGSWPALSTEHFRRPPKSGEQLQLSLRG